MLNYLWPQRRAPKQKTVAEQSSELLEAVHTCATDEELLRIVQTYPVPVIQQCQDGMGNSILDLVLKLSSSSSNGRQQRRFSGSKTTTAKGHLQLLDYLIHCTDAIVDDNGEIDNNHEGSTTNPSLSLETKRRSCYNSLIRVQSAGGTLPLHSACRSLGIPISRRCSGVVGGGESHATNEIEDQRPPVDPPVEDNNIDAKVGSSTQHLLDILEYLVQAYPKAVQIADVWGNLPLHEACDRRNEDETVVFPLEAILFLVQQWPQSVRTPNCDGNLPLHLAAAATASTSIVISSISTETKATDGSTAKTSTSTTTHVEDNVNGSDSNGSPRSILSVPGEGTMFDTNRYVMVQPEESSASSSSSSLFQLVEQSKLDILQYLVDYWPEAVHCKNIKGQTPMQYAAATTAVSGSGPCLTALDFLKQYKETPRAADTPVLQQQSSSNRGNSFDGDDSDGGVNKNNADEESSRNRGNPFDDDVNDGDFNKNNASDRLLLESSPAAVLERTSTNPFESDMLLESSTLVDELANANESNDAPNDRIVTIEHNESRIEEKNPTAFIGHDDNLVPGINDFRIVGGEDDGCASNELEPTANNEGSLGAPLESFDRAVSSAATIPPPGSEEDVPSLQLSESANAVDRFSSLLEDEIHGSAMSSDNDPASDNDDDSLEEKVVELVQDFQIDAPSSHQRGDSQNPFFPVVSMV